ncbi:MAG: type III ribulose-bisphosphate carboxylase [Nitrososphaerota archaeon]|nr:type III ribulose-bisphosphate carboxylase [Nitrososphaerota archaeon]MDG6939136.1 type III ribulose-bisphosphate carboxylase [Nitrososphaerota archaeon]
MAEKVEWYTDFVNTKRRPAADELVALFKVQPAQDFSMEEAAGRVASESSVGTWTTLTTLNKDIRSLMANAYKIEDQYVHVSYPLRLFEPGNMPQILSSIAGNIFGMKALKGLRLVDVGWPKELVKSFPGPQFGIGGVRDFMKVKGRPLTASVPKPKLGLDYKEHARHGYEAWVGGLDLLKDDENLTSQNFNSFADRAKQSFKMRDKAERETGERKSYLINITAETREMMKRAKVVKELGGEYVMIDVITAGWSALQTLRDTCQELGLAIHAHRAFHAAFTRMPTHGMSMVVVASVCRLLGVDQLHVGTVVGKLVSTKPEVLSIEEKLTADSSRAGEGLLGAEWSGTRPVFPVSSGGLHVGLIPPVLDMLGTNIVVQIGGGIWGHPSGGKAGAEAMRDAIDAYMKKISLEEYARKSRPLREALKKWGTATFR